MVGIIPCFLHEWNGRRQISLIGSGITDYLEPAINPQYAPEILNHVQRYLEAKTDWEICDWQDLSGETPLRDLPTNGALELNVAADTPCSEIPLTGTFEEFWCRRPKDLKRNVRRYTEKAEAAGTLEFKETRELDAEPLRALVQLHAARWKSRGEPGMINANGLAEFLCQVAREFAGRDMLQLFTLRFEGKIVAVILAFRSENTLFGYLSAFDPKYEKLGIGRTLLYEALRYSYANGYTAWNFLRGDEPYKFWWGAQIIPKCRVRLTRKPMAPDFSVPL